MNDATPSYFAEAMGEVLGGSAYEWHDMGQYLQGLLGLKPEDVTWAVVKTGDPLYPGGMLAWFTARVEWANKYGGKIDRYTIEMRYGYTDSNRVPHIPMPECGHVVADRNRTFGTVTNQGKVVYDETASGEYEARCKRIDETATDTFVKAVRAAKVDAAERTRRYNAANGIKP